MEEIRSVAQCSVCFELKTNHVSLPCGHSLCCDDLASVIKQKAICPFCRKGFEIPKDGIQGFPKNFDKNSLSQLLLDQQSPTTPRLGELIDGVLVCCECGKEATKWCEDDEEYYCGLHDELAHKIGKPKTHNRVPASKREMKYQPCPHHPKLKLDKYCLSCQFLACTECCILSHPNHNIKMVDQVMAQRKQTFLDEWHEMLSAVLTVIKKKFAQLEQDELDVQNNFKKLSTDIEKIDLVIQSLEKKKTEATHDLIQKKEEWKKTSSLLKHKLAEDLEDLLAYTQKVEDPNLKGAQWFGMETPLRTRLASWQKFTPDNFTAKFFEFSNSVSVLADFHSKIPDIYKLKEEKLERDPNVFYWKSVPPKCLLSNHAKTVSAPVEGLSWFQIQANKSLVEGESFSVKIEQVCDMRLNTAGMVVGFGPENIAGELTSFIGWNESEGVGWSASNGDLYPANSKITGNTTAYGGGDVIMVKRIAKDMFQFLKNGTLIYTSTINFASEPFPTVALIYASKVSLFVKFYRTC